MYIHIYTCIYIYIYIMNIYVYIYQGIYILEPGTWCWPLVGADLEFALQQLARWHSQYPENPIPHPDLHGAPMDVPEYPFTHPPAGGGQSMPTIQAGGIDGAGAGGWYELLMSAYEVPEEPPPMRSYSNVSPSTPPDAEQAMSSGVSANLAGTVYRSYQMDSQVVSLQTSECVQPLWDLVVRDCLRVCACVHVCSCVCVCACVYAYDYAHAHVFR